MEHADSESVRQHLLADFAYQEKVVRFIESHDEPRAAATFSTGKGRAAAVAVLTLMGAKLLPEGQFESGRLLKATNRNVFRDGEWRLCERSGWPDNQSCQNLLAWCWVKDDERFLIVINFRQEAAQARVHVPWDGLRGKEWRLKDVLSGETYNRSGCEMQDAGLYVDLGPWKCHLFQVCAL
jgi:hypothetical protein